MLVLHQEGRKAEAREMARRILELVPDEDRSEHKIATMVLAGEKIGPGVRDKEK